MASDYKYAENRSFLDGSHTVHTDCIALVASCIPVLNYKLVMQSEGGSVFVDLRENKIEMNGKDQQQNKQSRLKNLQSLVCDRYSGHEVIDKMDPQNLLVECSGVAMFRDKI